MILYMWDRKTDKIRATEDTYEWGRWDRGTDRRLAFTQLGDVEVSTVFLSFDQSLSLGDRTASGYRPVLWQTMVFGGSLDGEQERYCTKEEALAGHEVMVRRVRGA